LPEGAGHHFLGGQAPFLLALVITGALFCAKLAKTDIVF